MLVRSAFSYSTLACVVLLLARVSNCAAQVPAKAAAANKSLPLAGETFAVDGCQAFLILPPASANEASKRTEATPWVWYAPTLPGLPQKAERWMFEKLTAAGFAIAGIDVGESYGSPDGRAKYTALYETLVNKRGLSPKPVLLARSRGGLMLLCWACENADKVGGFAGIYPVCDIASYPGVEKAAAAYHLTPDELQAKLAEHNPPDRLEALAQAKVPLFAIHGDVDKVVPLEKNSGQIADRYTALSGRMELVVPKGQGHNMWPGFFESPELVAFVLRCADADRGAVDKPAVASAPARIDWPHAGGDRGGRRYSALREIHKGNVQQLQVAWTYHTRDAAEKSTIECTPIVVDGVMYITTARTKVVALDAATGKELWRFDPYEDAAKKWIKASGGVNRGVAFWSDGRPGGERRIFAGLSDGRLISLDAHSGKLDPAFADTGALDLRKDIERDISRMAYGPTSAPVVFEDLVFLGFSNDEGHPGAPGDIRAFDARSGKERWRFHTVPRPGEFGHDTWPADAWKERGGANAWGGLTLDEASGTLCCGTGSAGADFYGGDRAGTGLFANCTLALDARSGKRLWHFQTVHHDLWDHDNPCPPIVVNVQHDGRAIDAVAQLTKTGFCYLFDLKTGKPLFPVREQPSPASDIPGETAFATQPVPDKPPPFARQTFTDDDVTNISPQAHDFVRAALKTLRYGQAYSPPSFQGTVVTPGFHGGATWSGGSFDPETGFLYVNSNELPAIIALHREERGYRFGGYRNFEDDAGYPAIKPPWGRLTAIDLNKGKFAWQAVLGEFPELTARGIPPTGTENFGGTIVTAGGLVFIGGTKDEKFHAFDKDTGKLLWEYQLQAGGYATPCTYTAGGKQFVVIAAGGGGKLKTKSGDQFVAFALPRPPAP